MKFSLCLVIACLLAFAAVNEAAIARANFSNKQYPGMCVVNLNHILAPGEKSKVPDHPCAGLTCMENGFAEFKTCPAKAPPTGCKLRDFVNTKRPYPECCERNYDCTPMI